MLCESSLGQSYGWLFSNYRAMEFLGYMLKREEIGNYMEVLLSTELLLMVWKLSIECSDLTVAMKNFSNADYSGWAV
jgi:hypothetical protein